MAAFTGGVATITDTTTRVGRAVIQKQAIALTALAAAAGGDTFDFTSNAWLGPVQGGSIMLTGYSVNGGTATSMSLVAVPSEATITVVGAQFLNVPLFNSEQLRYLLNNSDAQAVTSGGWKLRLTANGGTIVSGGTLTATLLAILAR